jgi:hypothetical protein
MASPVEVPLGPQGCLVVPASRWRLLGSEPGDIDLKKKILGSLVTKTLALQGVPNSLTQKHFLKSYSLSGCKMAG